jgi:hypothetical protein
MVPSTARLDNYHRLARNRPARRIGKTKALFRIRIAKKKKRTGNRTTDRRQIEANRAETAPLEAE